MNNTVLIDLKQSSEAVFFLSMQCGFKNEGEAEVVVMLLLTPSYSMWHSLAEEKDAETLLCNGSNRSQDAFFLSFIFSLLCDLQGHCIQPTEAATH